MAELERGIYIGTARDSWVPVPSATQPGRQITAGGSLTGFNAPHGAKEVSMSRKSPAAAAIVLALTLAVVSTPAVSQARAGAAAGPLPSIEEKTAGMQRIDGFFPLYWDDDVGQLWMEISRFDTEVLHLNGLGA
ncbi:MAG: hypothetical protein V3W06_01795, partial [Acidimicrobiia bacterium]